MWTYKINLLSFLPLAQRDRVSHLAMACFCKTKRGVLCRIYNRSSHSHQMVI